MNPVESGKNKRSKNNGKSFNNFFLTTSKNYTGTNLKKGMLFRF